MDGWMSRAPVPMFWEIGEFRPHGYDSWSSQINALKMYTCRFLARCSTLLGWGMDWLAQCQDNVSEWDIRSWCWQPGLPVGWHYKVMSIHCHKSILVLMWPYLLLGHKTRTKKQALTSRSHSMVLHNTIIQQRRTQSYISGNCIFLKRKCLVWS